MAIITLYIDAAACPVKQEIYRVAERHALKGTALKVFVVTNSPIAVPRDPLIERVVVGAGMDELTPSPPLSRIRIIRHAAGRLSAGRLRRWIAG